ncbi:hypothetical protein DSM110093_00342 [Sulfitobacter sp. DSM 110093]|nr:hypothetical protein DSM110093_00342 [Sulfitobacter sp. DSM 110093]
MAQISVEIICSPGSLLRGNLHSRGIFCILRMPSSVAPKNEVTGTQLLSLSDTMVSLPLRALVPLVM